MCAIHNRPATVAAVAEHFDLDSRALAKIEGFPDYFVSADGRVFSTIRQTWRELKTQWPSRSYPTVTLISPEGNAKSRRVHRLVAKAFLPKPPPRHDYVLHGDGDRSNNRVDNLRWGTAKQNAADRENHGNTARGERHGNSRLTREQVKKLKALARRPELDWTYAQLARQYNVTPTTIASAMRGETWAHVPGPTLAEYSDDDGEVQRLREQVAALELQLLRERRRSGELLLALLRNTDHTPEDATDGAREGEGNI